MQPAIDNPFGFGDASAPADQWAAKGRDARFLLFAGEETTFTEFVLRERLALARRILIDPRFAGHTISAIAFESGFGDLSYFNHAFRRHYGATPSDIRAAEPREDWS
jgi:transcriptional regulator GlxA family with amidase domain